jgi:uroporphyrinogen-III synthase
MTLPLQNKIFISTRPEGHPDELPELLEANGATVIRWPLIEIRRASLSSHEKQQLLNLHQFHWIVFTSPNGVRHFFESLKELTGTSDIPPDLEMAVIGAKTNKTVQSYGYTPSFVNPGNTAEDFAKPFIHFLTGKGYKPKILLALGDLARNLLQDNLEETAQCTRINVYHTLIPEHIDTNMIRRIHDKRFDMIIFTSPSGIENFLKVYPEGKNKSIPMACIGSVTAAAAAGYGFRPLVVAEKSSAAGIAGSILNYYISKNN